MKWGEQCGTVKAGSSRPGRSGQANGQQRTGGQVRNFLGNAASQQSAEKVAAVSAHDNEVAVLDGGNLGDDAGGVALPQDVLDADIAARGRLEATQFFQKVLLLGDGLPFGLRLAKGDVLRTERIDHVQHQQAGAEAGRQVHSEGEGMAGAVGIVGRMQNGVRLKHGVPRGGD